MKKITFLIIAITALFINCTQLSAARKPVVYTIGDSTVKNGQGDGSGGLWGWGDPIRQFFDLEKIDLENHARGGTSSRTYRSLGLWQPVLDRLEKGDFVLIQFGHNDGGAINDDSRARGTLHGVGDESEEIDNILTGKHETVHTYGWYLSQYIKEIKEKKAIPILISPIPRNKWSEGKVGRNDESYGLWAKQVAEREKVGFVDLNTKMALAMENAGEANTTGVFFYKHDHTHTTAKGAILSASLVVKGIQEIARCKLAKYLLPNPVINFPVKKRIFLIGDSTVADGKDSLTGWGKPFSQLVDTTRAIVFNKARGGRSSRTFVHEGLWDALLSELKTGDFVLIQFGHNDSGAIDGEKFRGSIKGIGNETQEVTHPDWKHETVHSYGWYLKKFITESKEKGAIPIVFSHIPRNRWKDGKVERCDQTYGLWARQVAEENQAFFIDLNELVAAQYEGMGQEAVSELFAVDRTHTKLKGADLNARTVAEAIRKLRDCSLRAYVYENIDENNN